MRGRILIAVACATIIASAMGGCGPSDPTTNKDGDANVTTDAGPTPSNDGGSKDAGDPNDGGEDQPDANTFDGGEKLPDGGAADGGETLPCNGLCGQGIVCYNGSCIPATSCQLPGNNCPATHDCVGDTCVAVRCPAVPCTNGHQCDASTGECTLTNQCLGPWTPVPPTCTNEGGDCDDGDPCTDGSTCSRGICFGSPSPRCHPCRDNFDCCGDGVLATTCDSDNVNDQKSLTGVCENGQCQTQLFSCPVGTSCDPSQRGCAP